MKWKSVGLWLTDNRGREVHKDRMVCLTLSRKWENVTREEQF